MSDQEGPQRPISDRDDDAVGSDVEIQAGDVNNQADVDDRENGKHKRSQDSSDSEEDRRPSARPRHGDDDGNRHRVHQDSDDEDRPRRRNDSDDDDRPRRPGNDDDDGGRDRARGSGGGDDDDVDRRRQSSRRGDEDEDRPGRRRDARADQENGQRAAAAAAEAVPVQRKPVTAGKAGGVYIPPFKLARMMKEVQDRASPEYQKLTWEALKKSLNGIINKVNATNIKNLLAEVFRENLVRGRGLFCRSLMKSQLASPSFSPVYAALVAVVNTKFPEIGELLLHRLALQFMRSYKRNDKPVCTAAAKFLAHLINQGVAHELLALEMIILMLNKPSADSVEMACDFTKEIGAYLQDVMPKGLFSVFEQFRAVLHDGQIEKRTQFIIEGLFAIRKAGFAESGYPSVKTELDLVEAEDQITHEIELEGAHDPVVGLDVFKVDPDYDQHEKEYRAISREILGEEDESSEDEDKPPGDDDDDEEEDESEDPEEAAQAAQAAARQQAIEDATQTNLVNLRRTIYLTIMSSMDFEEAGHKLLKIGIQPGQEIELVTMVIECCAQERTYKRFYGLLAQRFCYYNKAYMEKFDECFRNQYAVIFRLEINKLRNLACLFGHLLNTDAIPWSVLNCIRLTEEDTTSSSRIFIKYLFQELSSSMGIAKLAARINDPTTPEWYDGVFPKDTQANLRFAINFFTSIGLGGLTDKMREFYKEMPRIAAERAAQEAEAAAKLAARQRALRGGETSSDSDSSSSSDSDSDSSDSSSSSSGSDSDSSGSSSSDDGSSDSSDSSSSSSDSEDERRRKKQKEKSRAKREVSNKNRKSDRMELDRPNDDRPQREAPRSEREDRRSQKDGDRTRTEDARERDGDRRRADDRSTRDRPRDEDRDTRQRNGREDENRRRRDDGYDGDRERERYRDRNADVRRAAGREDVDDGREGKRGQERQEDRRPSRDVRQGRGRDEPSKDTRSRRSKGSGSDAEDEEGGDRRREDKSDHARDNGRDGSRPERRSRRHDSDDDDDGGDRPRRR